MHVLSQIRQAHQLLAKRHFDFLLFRLDVLPIAPLYITKMFRQPFALKTLGHNVLKALADRGGWFGRSLGGINRRLVKGLVRTAVVADSVSPIQIDFLRDRLDLDDDHVVWIDNAVNTERFRVESTTEARHQLNLTRFDNLVGYVGTRPWERGGMQLIEAAARITHKYPNLGIVILGEGNGVRDLHRRAQELGVGDRCVFPGYVPFHHVPTYVNSLDVGVSLNLLPSREASSELKVRQYLACGKPVLASPGGNDFLMDAGLGSIVRPRDIDVIARELDRWLGMKPHDRAAFAHQASDYTVRHLSVDSATNQRLDLWSQRLQSAVA